MTSRRIPGGSVTHNRWVKKNKPPRGENWVWLTRAMLESSAWQALSINGRRFVDRVMIEHVSHAGGENGNLPVTFQDFERAGIRHGSVADARAEVDALGLIDIIDPGSRSYGDIPGRPGRYALTWLPRKDGLHASHRWKRFQTIDEARLAASVKQKARSGSAPKARSGSAPGHVEETQQNRASPRSESAPGFPRSGSAPTIYTSLGEAAAADRGEECMAMAAMTEVNLPAASSWRTGSGTVVASKTREP
jgi:hypothetical protein